MIKQGYEDILRQYNIILERAIRRAYERGLRDGHNGHTKERKSRNFSSKKGELWQTKILNALKEKPLSVREIAESINHNNPLSVASMMYRLKKSGHIKNVRYGLWKRSGTKLRGKSSATKIQDVTKVTSS